MFLTFVQEKKKSEYLEKRSPRRWFTDELNRITNLKKYNDTLKFKVKDRSFMSNKKDLEFEEIENLISNNFNDQ
jgi:DNA polymerase III sliding clamp (beta) subunit (PCNA family)